MRGVGGVVWIMLVAPSCSGDDAGTACAEDDPDSCLDDNICVAGRCEYAFDREYAFIGVHIQADPSHDWDDGQWPATLPDLRFEAQIYDKTNPSDNEPDVASEVLVDRLSTELPGPITFVARKGESLFLVHSVVDVEDDHSVPIASCATWLKRAYGLRHARNVTQCQSVSDASRFWYTLEPL